MNRTSTDRLSAEDQGVVPTVLAILVVRDGAAWLRECLRGLSRQTHPRLGVLAVDNGSTDGSREILEQALGSERVLTPATDRGVAGAVGSALKLSVAREADYVLVVHDDTVLAADAVSRMVEAAEQVEGAGVVGAKVVDWDDPRILREVGRASDRFGHVHSSLEDDEVDHGQYDRVREVLFVSSCAMLVSHPAWERVGLPDERLASYHEDPDFCWRVRLAGFRVLSTPLARARHRDATERGERRDRHRLRGPRYYRERAALMSMLKNYGALSLLRLLPLYGVEVAGKILLFAATRRLEDAYQVLAASGWNLLHLPGTLRRRIRAQSVRSVPDRSIQRFMVPATDRVRRWVEAAGALLGAEEREREEEAEPLRARATSLPREHPVLVASVLALGVGALASRHLFGDGALEGGVLPAFPASPTGFFRELVSGFRTTGLGGTEPASPALALLGGVSAVLFGSTAVAQKVFVAAGPPLAAALAYRTLVRQTNQRGSAVVAAVAYGLSAVVLWAFSEGRIDLLMGLVAMPAIAGRLDTAFRGDRPARPWHFVVGTGMAVAFGAVFLPGILLAVGVLVVVHALTAGRRLVAGLSLAAPALACGAALAFPVVVGVLAEPAGTLGSGVGEAHVGSLARLVLVAGPASGPFAWFLPISALIAYSAVGKGNRLRASRALLTAAASVGLAWAAAAGYLPGALSNPPAYIVLAAVSETAVVAYGLASVISGIERQALGYRQLAAAALAGLLGGGIALSALVAAVGEWSIGETRLPPAWSVVSGGALPDSRVLWIGRPARRPFPPPGGDPQGSVQAASASVRYSLSDGLGVRALDIGRWSGGGGTEYLEGSLGEILSGTTRHGGALLSVLGVRYVVADERDISPATTARLEEQVDLDKVLGGGLLVFENGRAHPPEVVLRGRQALRGAGASDLLAIASSQSSPASPLHRVPGGWSGSGHRPGLVLLGVDYSPGWELTHEGRNARGKPAYGWAIGLPSPSGAFSVRYTRQGIRTAEMAVLAVLWLAAFWITRRPASR